jgi:hypothetical protein
MEYEQFELLEMGAAHHDTEVTSEPRDTPWSAADAEPAAIGHIDSAAIHETILEMPPEVIAVGIHEQGMADAHAAMGLEIDQQGAGEHAPGETHLPRTPVVEQQEVHEAPQSEAPRVDAMVDRLQLLTSGRRRDEIELDVAEARKLNAWMEAAHPEWLSTASSSRIDSGSMRTDLRIEYFAKEGKQTCRLIRSTIESYETFCMENSHRIAEGQPYPPTEELVAWFALWRLDRTRALKARTGAAFKGTSGHSAVKALGYAHNVVGAPFPDSVRKTRLVETACTRPPDAAEGGKEVAHAGVFVQGWLEGVAGGAFPDGTPATEVQRDYACVLAMQGITSMRTVEMLRSSIKGSPEGGPRARVTLQCAGGKAPRATQMQPFEATCPLAGFTKEFEKHALAFAERYARMPFVFRRYVRARKRGGHSSVALEWESPPRCAEPEHVVDMFYELMERCGMDRDACRRAGLTPYGLRHLLPDLTRAAGWPLEDRMELGRWSLAMIRSLILTAHAAGVTTHATRAQAAGSMQAVTANLYSRGKAAADREFTLRERAIAIVTDYVGGRAWKEVVPVQAEPPSFQFMIPTAIEPVEEEQGGDSDGE